MEYSPLHGKMFLYYVILCLALITNLVSMRLRRLPIGRAWEALREDEIACRSLGVNTTNTKLTAFALGAFFGGLAGSFFAVRQGFISPESFTFTESATILAIVVLGGMGSQIGVALAAVFLIGGFEMLRELDFLRAVMSDGTGVIVICLGRVHLRRRARAPPRRPDRAGVGRRVAGAAHLPAPAGHARRAVRHARFRSGAVSRPAVRPRDGGDDGGQAARLRLDPLAVDLPQGAKAVSGDLVKEGHG